DSAVLGSIAWFSRSGSPSVAIGAIVALCASFLSSYVRARGAALGYSVEESHMARGIRYGLVSAGLLFDGLGWAVWSAAALSVLAAAVRTGQVAREARACAPPGALVSGARTEPSRRSPGSAGRSRPARGGSCSAGRGRPRTTWLRRPARPSQATRPA